MNGKKIARAKADLASAQAWLPAAKEAHDNALRWRTVAKASTMVCSCGHSPILAELDRAVERAALAHEAAMRAVETAQRWLARCREEVKRRAVSRLYDYTNRWAIVSENYPAGRARWAALTHSDLGFFLRTQGTEDERRRSAIRFGIYDHTRPLLDLAREESWRRMCARNLVRRATAMREARRAAKREEAKHAK